MSDLPIPFPVDRQPLTLQALDIQHDTDPEDDHGIARRIPHFGHALLFFSIILASLAAAFVATYFAAHIRTPEAALQRPGLGLAAQALAYVLAFALSFWIFPLLWHRTFFEGVHWNSLIARRNLRWVLGAAILVSVAAQLGLHFVPTPRYAPIDQLMMSQHLVWFTALFGIFGGPFMEELAFRGFLLPALATAYDWFTFPKTPAGFDRWQRSTGHSTPALVIAALVSSIPFALMHAAQIGYAWGIIGILYGVSLALSYIRIRTQSLACSTLMHATYNFTIFALLFAASGGFRHLDKISQ